MNLTLWFAPGSCSRVPLISLEEAGVPFEARPVAFARGEHRRAEFLAINPAGKVPVLVADGVAFTQNPAILRFLARQLPAARLLPDAPDAAADAALVSRLVWFSADLHPLVTRIRVPQFICDKDEAIPRVREMAMENMRFQLAGMEKALGAQPFVLGEAWSVFDAYLYWVWFRITGAGFDPAPFPALAAHAQRIEQRPAVQRALAREEAVQAELDRQGLGMPWALRLVKS